MILTCSWIMDNDEPCGERCEGNTCYCASHGRQLRKEVADEKKQADKRKQQIAKQAERNKLPRKPPNKVSAKREEENIDYKLLRQKFLMENPACMIHANNYCTVFATTVHHSAGRIGKLFLDVSKWKGACMNCHEYCEHHPKEAKEKGWSESRLATIKETI